MEPVSTALAIAGFVPVCVQAFNLIETASNAKQTAEVQSRRIQLLRGNFIAWSEMWGIYAEPPKKPPVLTKHSKFVLHLDSTSNRHLILFVLLWLSQLFNDAESLESLYGIKIEGLSEDAEPIPQRITEEDVVKKREQILAEVGPISRRFNWLMGLRFAIRGQDKFKSLVETLQEHVDSLYRMCSENMANNMGRLANLKALRNSNDSNSLMCSEKAAKKAAEKAEKQGSKYSNVYTRLASIASFKLRVPLALDDDDVRWLDASSFDNVVGRWNDGAAELATDRNANVYRIIEWKEDSALYSKADIENLAKIFCMPNLPQELMILKCLGIFRDRRNRSRYGFVYKLPTHIAPIPSNNCPLKFRNPKLRMPETLLHRIREPRSAPQMPDLDQRFRIAKALVESMIVLHETGWVHKRVRASSVLFLPAQSKIDPTQPSSTHFKDLDHPYLTGYASSRSDSGDLDRSDSITRVTGSAAISKLRDDIYQFPSKRSNPRMRYRHIFDVYSLGCVLLEIGLWRSLYCFKKTFDDAFNHKPYPNRYDGFRAMLRGLAREELRGQAGQIYAHAVWTCLSVTGLEGPDDALTLLINDVAFQLDQLNV